MNDFITPNQTLMSDSKTAVTSPTSANITDDPETIIPIKFNSSLLKKDNGLMLNYAISSGKELPNNLVFGENISDADLIGNYNNLRKVIAPATVESIRYINTQMILRGNTMKWYQIPIFTKCVVIAAIALVALIVISLSPIVNETNQLKGLLESSGMTLLYNLAFICASSLLGVMFYLLKTMGDKIRTYTLLPVNTIELNASIIIGVISGFVISELFAFTLTNIGSQSVEIHKMTLALLGGFSSDAIFSTLQGIVNKLKSLVTA